VRLPGSILQGILARAALVLLRIYLGVVWLLAAWSNLRGDSTSCSTGFLEKVAPLSNPSLMMSVLTWTELLVGLTLVLGLMTRLSATVALLVVVNCMLGKGEGLGQLLSGQGAFAVIAVALLVGAAGRTLGLDALLAKRWPRSPLW
jgi:uncharacterized membrane protein YphA (DoxX/SURF4 family)